MSDSEDKYNDPDMKGFAKGTRKVRVQSFSNKDRKDSLHSHNSTKCHSSAEGSGQRNHEFIKSNYTEVMHDRWWVVNSKIPQCDAEDIKNEHPLFNNGQKPSPERQHHPEYT